MGEIPIVPYGARSWQTAVACSALLPSIGNSIGDVRVAKDTGALYEWNGSR
jgi:hypothetical protein